MANLLVIDTNQYAGNFERTLYKFIFAHENDDVYDSKNVMAYYSNEPDLKSWYEDNYSEYLFDFGYGKQPVGILTNSNYVNNGYGIHKQKDDPDVQNWKTKWPAYMSVGICFSGKIPDNIKTLIHKRIQEFIDNNIEENLVVENIRFVKIGTMVKDT